MFEVIIAVNLPKLTTNTKPQIPKVQRTPARINPEKITPRRIIFKLPKIKDKNINLGKGSRRRLTENISVEIMQAGRK